MPARLDVELVDTPTEVWTVRAGYTEASIGVGSRPVVLWSFEAGHLDEAVGDDESVVVIDSEVPRVVSVDSATGEEQWSQEQLPGNGVSSSDGDTADVRLLGRDLVMVGYRDLDLVDWTVLLDRANGSVRPELRGIGWYNVRRVADTVFAGTSEEMVAYDATDGRERWRRPGSWLTSDLDGNLVNSRRVETPPRLAGRLPLRRRPRRRRRRLTGVDARAPR